MTYLLNAQFIGKNSLGYKTGRTYTLEVLEFSWFDKFRLGVSLKIRRVRDGAGDCPYTSMQSFLKNWKVRGLK